MQTACLFVLPACHCCRRKGKAAAEEAGKAAEIANQEEAAEPVAAQEAEAAATESDVFQLQVCVKPISLFYPQRILLPLSKQPSEPV